MERGDSVGGNRRCRDSFDRPAGKRTYPDDQPDSGSVFCLCDCHADHRIFQAASV